MYCAYETAPIQQHTDVLKRRVAASRSEQRPAMSRAKSGMRPPLCQKKKTPFSVVAVDDDDDDDDVLPVGADRDSPLERANVTVALLPAELYVRLRWRCEQRLRNGTLATALVVHCQSKKGAQSKLAELAAAGVLYVAENRTTDGAPWRAVLEGRGRPDGASTASFIDRLKSILIDTQHTPTEAAASRSRDS
mmetsp:Transcript_737/g.2934  ORF Transcript_737/g.2934 Transcript_737/m.2934 type:complete len:192 (-) Transcript_737:79-654(-)